MRSMPNVCSAAMNGGWLKMPLVVIQTCSRIGWLGGRLRWPMSADRGLVDAHQHHRQHLAHVADDHLELGMLVEACRPTPCAAMWIATSECQPQPALSSTRSAPPAGRSSRPAAPTRAAGADGCRSARRARPPPPAGRHSSGDRGSGLRQVPLIMAPTSFRSFTARLSSAAQASGLAIGSAAKPAKRLGCLAHDGRQVVVQLAGERDAVRAGHQIGAGAGVGEHLHRDAGVVHRLEPLLADLGQPAPSGWPGRAAALRGLKPRAAMASGLTYFLTRAGTVKCSSSATTRMDDVLPNFAREVVAFIAAVEQAALRDVPHAPGEAHSFGSSPL